MRVLQIFTEVCRVLYKGRVAQSVEQRIENPRVGGSIPSLGTSFHMPQRGRRARSASRRGCRLPVLIQHRWTVESDSGKLIRTRFKGQSYVFFRWDSDNIRYDLRHWVQDNDGQWISFFSTFPQPVGNNEALWRDIYTRLQKNDNWIWVYAVARVKLRLNRLGAIEHAKFLSMGCESPMGSINGKNFGGACKLRAKMIDPLDLPFDPQMSK